MEVFKRLMVYGVRRVEVSVICFVVFGDFQLQKAITKLVAIYTEDVVSGKLRTNELNDGDVAIQGVPKHIQRVQSLTNRKLINVDTNGNMFGM